MVPHNHRYPSASPAKIAQYSIIGTGIINPESTVVDMSHSIMILLYYDIGHEPLYNNTGHEPDILDMIHCIIVTAVL
jgi:hypothetical protein